MTYLDDEKSVHDSKPVELYKFVGTYASFFYTSAPVDQEYDGDTYAAITIERTEVNEGTQDDDGLDITVTLPVESELAVTYAFTVSPPKLSLTIYRVQPSGVGVYWTGPVNNVSVDSHGRASLSCPSALGAALAGNVPSVYYQTPCNNTLYDQRCKIDEALWSQDTTVSSVSEDNKTISIGSIGSLDGKLLGGDLALANGERRMIVAQTGTDITVNFPFSAAITAGLDCRVAAGCNYAYHGDCKAKFNNQINFNGFPYIPPINPFADGIEPAEDGVTDDACLPTPINFWGTITVDTTLGPNTPVMGPWAWHFDLYKGDVLLGSMYSADNYTITDGGGGYPQSPPFAYLNGWKSYFYDSAGGAAHGETGWVTDPFAAGNPDRLEVVTIQWPYNNYIFPGGSTFGTDNEGGSMSILFQRPGGAILNFGTIPIFGLWPASYTLYPV